MFDKPITPCNLIFPGIHTKFKSTLFQIICRDCSSLKDKNSATLELEAQDAMPKAESDEYGDWTISITCPLCSAKEIIKVCNGDGSF